MGRSISERSAESRGFALGRASFRGRDGIPGYSGDGGPAISAQVGEVYGVTLDAAGNIYFTDAGVGGSRVREVTTDGKIRTLAGMGIAGYNGDNQPATSAALDAPSGVAVDNSGNIYVADANNCRVRRFTIGGNITTVVGTGNCGMPVNGPATLTPIGWPIGISLDSAGNLYVVDSLYNSLLKVTPGGTLIRVAGDLQEFGAPGDGPATSASLDQLYNVAADRAGNVFLVQQNHQVRKLTPDGNLTTVAGRLHFAGDGGAATAALLNLPNEILPDAGGDVYIYDGPNYRIRKVTPDGTINTWGGNGIPGYPPSNGSPIAGANLPYAYAMTWDASGNMYLGTENQVLKLTPDAKVFVIAGNGNDGDSGDGGPATAATIGVASGIAVDASGNIYVADALANRVRVVAANTGIITAFAGTGARGSGGDGGLATAAQISITPPEIVQQTPLAVDGQGNVYIGDANNGRVRMVSPQDVISTVVGNGKFGIPADGSKATAAPFCDAASMAVDRAGALYVACRTFQQIYAVSGGTIRRITGNYKGPFTDGSPALGLAFQAEGLKVDSNGDLYAADPWNNAVRKLILNSPVSFSMVDGNNQTAPAGQTLAKALKVQIIGRAGVGLTGATVNFTVTSGSATLSAASTQTDGSGTAGVSVTLPASAGTVMITATAPGTGMAALQFTETATTPPPTCTVPQPVVTSANTAGDFGGSAVFAPGSWLEIKGSSLAQSTRPWSGGDFDGTNAPTALDGVSVTINGKSAFVAYISPNQINVQAPADTAAGAVPLVVTSAACASAPLMVQEAPVAPGVLAPSSFSSGGTQYLVATLPDGSFVGNPGLISGVPFRPAAPGDSITAYGIGFGATTPAVAPGTITGTANSIAGLTVLFGSTPATVTYAGLAPGVVGLYQFNIVVPELADGDYPITFQEGATKVGQAVYLTVHR